VGQHFSRLAIHEIIMVIASSNRMPTVMQVSTASDHERPKSSDSMKKDMWSSMLDNVASGKRLPEKNILVLGKF
jgi:dynein light intermediate chain 1, cytosolic